MKLSRKLINLCDDTRKKVAHPYLKYGLIGFAGAVETYIYAWYLLLATQHSPYSSIVMVIHAFVYISLIKVAISGISAWKSILAYAVGCGIGNLLRILTINII